MRIVYTLTSDPQRLLRNTVVEALRRRYVNTDSWSADFDQPLDQIPGLAADAFRARAQPFRSTAPVATHFVRRLKQYKCPAPNCTATFEQIIQETKVFGRFCRIANLPYRMTSRERA